MKKSKQGCVDVTPAFFSSPQFSSYPTFFTPTWEPMPLLDVFPSTERMPVALLQALRSPSSPPYLNTTQQVRGFRGGGGLWSRRRGWLFRRRESCSGRYTHRGNIRCVASKTYSGPLQLCQPSRNARPTTPKQPQLKKMTSNRLLMTNPVRRQLCLHLLGTRTTKMANLKAATTQSTPPPNQPRLRQLWKPPRLALFQRNLI